MFVRSVFILLFTFLVPLTAQATVAGSVEHLSGEAWIERSGERISLHNGDRVDAGDVVVTTQSGRVKLRMQDESKIFVGRESRITIDKYEMRKGSLFSGSFNMLWGKVRFLVAKLNTGGSSFSVQTKTATIGVRGTQFAVIANRPSAAKQIVPTTVMLFEGAVVGRSISGNLTNIKPGKLVVFNPAGKITKRNITGQDVKKLNLKPLEFTKTPAKSRKPEGKVPLRNRPEAKPVERTKPVKRTLPDIKPDAVTTAPGKIDPLGGRAAVPAKFATPVGSGAALAPKAGLPAPSLGGRPVIGKPVAPKSPVTVKPPVKVAPAPRVSVPAPKVSVPAPKVSVPAPKVSVPVPKVSVPVPKVNVPAPRVVVPTFKGFSNVPGVVPPPTFKR